MDTTKLLEGLSSEERLELLRRLVQEELSSESGSTGPGDEYHHGPWHHHQHHHGEGHHHHHGPHGGRHRGGCHCCHC